MSGPPVLVRPGDVIRLAGSRVILEEASQIPGPRSDGLVGGTDGRDTPRAFPRHWVRPTVTYTDRLQLRVGELELELHHSRGETDDHTWTWIPSRRAACIGDLMVWVFPNAGNPQKVQRYPLEWAHALREIAALEPELLLPAHGLPIDGRDRIRAVLDDVATALEILVRQTLDLMNQGATLDEIVHSVEVPASLLTKPYLAPIYDEPEFVVRNIWRQYGGWYDGDPSHLKPAPAAALAAELAALAGGAGRLAERAREVAASGDLRLAGHLAELAAQAAPDDEGVHAARAEVFAARAAEEASTMSKGIYSWAEHESQLKAEG